MTDEERLVQSIETRCKTVEDVQVLAAKIDLSLPDTAGRDDIKGAAALLVADAALSGKMERLRSAVATRSSASLPIRLLNVLLLAVFLVVTPAILQEIFPWMWPILVVAGAVLALAWSLYKTYDEGGVLAFIRYLIGQRASVVRLGSTIVVTALTISILWWVLPDPDDTVLVLLPYSGTLIDDLAKGNNLNITVGGKAVGPLSNKSGSALFLGWPPMRTRWFMTCKDCEVHSQLPDLNAIASKVLADGRSKQSAVPDVVHDWTIDRQFICTSRLKAGTVVTVTISADNSDKPLRLHPWPSGKPSASYVVLHNKGAEVLILSER